MEPDILMEGIPPEEGKFCADCEHLVGVRWKEDSDNWKCGHPRNAKEGDPDLVSGMKIRLFKYPIRDLRYSQSFTDNTEWFNGEKGKACGKEGLWYKKYEAPEYKDTQASAPKVQDEVGPGKKSGKFSLDL